MKDEGVCSQAVLYMLGIMSSRVSENWKSWSERMAHAHMARNRAAR
jgi:hypothetical protein